MSLALAMGASARADTFTVTNTTDNDPGSLRQAIPDPSIRHCQVNGGDHRLMESLYRRHRFPPEIISHAVWLYHRFTLSLRDFEDLLAARGVTVSYEAIRSWCRKFGPAYARTLRRRQGRLGDI